MRIGRKRRVPKDSGSFFRAYLLSDIVLILLVLLALIPFVQRTLSIANQRERQTLRSLVVQAADGLDAMLSNLQSMLMSADNAALSDLAAIQGTLKGSDYYKLAKATQFVQMIVRANRGAEDILIHYGRNNAILRAGSSFDSRGMFDAYYHRSVSLETLFPQDQAARFLPAWQLLQGIPVQRRTVFGYCFALSSTGNGRACVLIPTDYFLNGALVQALREDGFILLCDASGTPVVQWGDIPEDEAAARRYQVVDYVVDNRRLSVRAGISQASMSAALYDVAALLTLSLLAALVIGAGISLLNATRGARSVRRLAERLDQYNQRIHGKEEQIDRLQGTLRKLAQENRSFEEQLHAYRSMLHESAVTRLFTTSCRSEEDAALLRAEIGEPDGPFLVAYGALRDLPLLDTHEEEMSLVALEHLKKELPPRAICCPIHRAAVALLIPQTDLDAFEQSAGSRHYRWSYSRSLQGLQNVPRALEEARMAHSLKRRGSPATLGDCQALYQFLVSGERDQALAVLGRLFRDADPGSLRYSYDGACTTLHLAAQETGLPMAAPPLDPAADAEAMRGELDGIIRDFCERVERGKRSHNEELKTRVLEYIRENFQDGGLYGASIAERAGISEKYLYNFIKEQTGQSVGEYIQTLRMNLALRLLEEGTEPVSRIYAKVGFNSNNSFYKAFKRAYGVSPSQYRDVRRGGAEPARPV